MKNVTKGKAGISLSMMIFGSIGLLVRYIDAQSSQIALSRAATGSLFLFLLFILAGKRIKSSENFSSNTGSRKKFVLLLLSGAAIGFNWIFLFQAYRYTTIAVATVSYYFAPVFVILLSPLILKENLSRTRLVAVFAALIGLTLTIIGELSQSSSALTGVYLPSGLTGIGYGLAAALLYASVILISKSVGTYPGLKMTQIQLASGFVVLLPYVAVTSGFSELFDIDLRGAILLIILGSLHTGLAYYIYFSSAQLVKAQSIAILSYIDPLFAILFAAVLLREIPGPMQLIGGVLILGATFFSETAADLLDKNLARKRGEL